MTEASFLLPHFLEAQRQGNAGRLSSKCGVKGKGPGLCTQPGLPAQGYLCLHYARVY
jgi:hypothetical protein